MITLFNCTPMSICNYSQIIPGANPSEVSTFTFFRRQQSLNRFLFTFKAFVAYFDIFFEKNCEDKVRYCLVNLLAILLHSSILE